MPTRPAIRLFLPLLLCVAPACRDAGRDAARTRASAGLSASAAAKDMPAPAYVSIEPSLMVKSRAPEGAPSAPPLATAGDALTASGGGGGPESVSAAQIAPSTIIRSGSASVQVDSLEPAVARVEALATRLGGYVADVSLQTGHEQLRSGTLELRIPAPRFDEAVRGLTPIGKIEAVNTVASDVGEEMVDIDARIANGRRLEARLVDLLARRTGKLEEVLAVERELARVRTEIERYEGRLRYLRARVALSTLTLTIHEPPPLAGGTPGRHPIREAFRDAWRNFVALTAGVIASLGVVIPLGIVGAGVVVLVRRRWHPRRPDGGEAA